MHTHSVVTTLGLIAATVTMTGCGLVPSGGSQRATSTTPAASAAPTTTTNAPAPAPNVIIVPAPAPASPSVVTQYQYPPGYNYPYGTNPPLSSGADADFLARLRARDIVTPGDAIEVAGGRQVCANLSGGSDITTEANALKGSPYYYSNALAGYFAGESIKVYCPQFSYQLK
jgi:Protein of unknown function (DUF732)